MTALPNHGGCAISKDPCRLEPARACNCNQPRTGWEWRGRYAPPLYPTAAWPARGYACSHARRGAS
jgi:hypothetical protein